MANTIQACMVALGFDGIQTITGQPKRECRMDIAGGEDGALAVSTHGDIQTGTKQRTLAEGGMRELSRESLALQLI